MAKPIKTNSPRRRSRPPFDCIALLLQGGGALGAYQAGVYEALAEANLHPDWTAGISIGAINSALIAGNPPESRVEKLREFWQQITTPLPLLNHAPQMAMAAEPPSSIRCSELSGNRFASSSKCDVMKRNVVGPM